MASEEAAGARNEHTEFTVHISTPNRESTGIRDKSPSIELTFTHGIDRNRPAVNLRRTFGQSSLFPPRWKNAKNLSSSRNYRPATAAMRSPRSVLAGLARPLKLPTLRADTRSS